MTIHIADSGQKIDLDAGRRAFIRNAGLFTAGAAVIGVTGLPTIAEAQSPSEKG